MMDNVDNRRSLRTTTLPDKRWYHYLCDDRRGVDRANGKWFQDNVKLYSKRETLELRDCDDCGEVSVVEYRYVVDVSSGGFGDMYTVITIECCSMCRVAFDCDKMYEFNNDVIKKV